MSEQALKARREFSAKLRTRLGRLYPLRQEIEDFWSAMSWSPGLQVGGFLQVAGEWVDVSTGEVFDRHPRFADFWEGCFATRDQVVPEPRKADRVGLEHWVTPEMGVNPYLNELRKRRMVLRQYRAEKARTDGESE